MGSAEWARRINTASPNDLELSSVRFACWHPYITHLKDEDGFFYLYKNLNACVPSRRCLSSSGSIYLYKNLNACGKPPQEGTESTGTTCQGSKHLDFYINKKPPQGAQKARETTCQGWKHLDFYINKKPPQRGTESTGDNLPGMEAFRFFYK